MINRIKIIVFAFCNIIKFFFHLSCIFNINNIIKELR